MWTRERAIIHALRRNGIGARCLVAIAELGEATAGRLSIATGASRQRIRWAIRGRSPDCIPAHCLKKLGFVTERREGKTVLFRITARGRRWAVRVHRGLHVEELVVRAVRKPDPT